jgi:hypothetical protein
MERVMTETVLDPKLEELLRLKNDPWHFAQTCVWTRDEADKWAPIKKYPNKDYLHLIVQLMHREPLLALVKHRRMIITWSACVVGLHDALFNEERRIAYVSKKEEDSDDLVRRCKFIFENIPPESFPIPKPEMRYKYTELSFPETGSIIKGYAEGADQLRQYGHSRIFADEMAFWDHAREAYASMRPTIQGGGQLCLFSTRFPGFFKSVIEDTVEDMSVAPISS